MTPRAATNGRTPRWLRTAVILLVVVIGAMAVRHSLGLALAGSKPELALRLDGENAFAKAQVALSQAQRQTDHRWRDRVYDLARDSLARDASNVAALVSFGLASNRADQVAAVFTVAERLSRRNLVTELWMIETAVARGDVNQALRHYDIALRTVRSAPSILFPVLVDAAGDPALLPAIAHTLGQRPPWGGLYLQQLAQSGADRARAATLFTMLKRQGVPTGVAADAALYARLIEVRLFDDAWTVYAADHRDASRNTVRNPAFSDQPAVPTPFDWLPSDNEFLSARIDQAVDGKGELAFSSVSGEGGEVARQMLVLGAGVYRIEVDAVIEGADAAPPYLQLLCQPSNGELLRMPLTLHGTTGGRFTVPVGCPAQILSLAVQPASSMAEVNGTIRGVRVDRMR